MNSIVIVNASPNTGNMGVTALCLSALHGLKERVGHRLVVADNGRGFRKGIWTVGTREIHADLMPLSPIRRYWRSDCLKTVKVLSSIGGIGSRTAREMVKASVILDVSGGDSFTDLYGEKRFRAMIDTKKIAIENGIPLILLPQTLGPFTDPDRRAEAEDVLRKATAVFVRDLKSFEYLRSVLGKDFDPSRHQLGLDMAIGMPTTVPDIAPQKIVAEWLFDADRSYPVFGLNTSGLLCSMGNGAKKAYGLADTHLNQLEVIARTALDSEPNSRLLLVPHVIRPSGDPESDRDAAMDLKERLMAYGNRIQVLPQFYSATELKWIISQLDWFAGARMHATIAGFSTATPTMGLGYSDKAYGVFDSCDIGAQVADLRKLSLDQLAHATRQSVNIRHLTRVVLQNNHAALMQKSRVQMDTIAAVINSVSGEAACGFDQPKVA